MSPPIRVLIADDSLVVRRLTTTIVDDIAHEISWRSVAASTADNAHGSRRN